MVTIRTLFQRPEFTVYDTLGWSHSMYGDGCSWRQPYMELVCTEREVAREGWSSCNAEKTQKIVSGEEVFRDSAVAVGRNFD